MATSVRLLDAADTDAVATALARAFAGDPIFEFLVPDLDPATRAERITPFFQVDVRQKAVHGTVWIAGDDDQSGLEGAALWAPPGKWKSTIGEGFGQARMLVRAAGLGVLRRLPRMLAIEKAHPREPHWYLAVLGTDPAHQGKGVGTSLIAPVLERCDAEGIPAYLESSKVANVPFYERFGFKVIRDLTVARGGPTLPLMWRDPH